jgi:hypothetical protein
MQSDSCRQEDKPTGGCWGCEITAQCFVHGNGRVGGVARAKLPWMGGRQGAVQSKLPAHFSHGDVMMESVGDLLVPKLGFC